MAGALLAAATCQKNPVTLSGGSNHASNTGANAVAWFKWEQDGNVYSKDNSGSWTQVSTAKDWIRPTSEAPGTYQIRVTSVTGDTGSFFSTEVENTWYTLSTSAFFCSVTDTTIAFGGKSCTFTIEIRKGTGPTLASASYTLSADREDF